MTTLLRSWPLAVGGTAVGALAALLGPAFGALVAAILIAGCLVWYPLLAIGFLVAARSSLDFFNEYAVLPPPLGLNPAALLGVTLILLASGMVILLARARARIIAGGPVTALWSAWLVLGAFGVIVGAFDAGAHGLSLGSRELVRLGSLLALHLLIVNLGQHRGAARLVMWCIVAGMAVPISYGVYQVIFGGAGHNIYGVARVNSTFVHPNSFGMYMSATTLICLGLAFDLKHQRAARAVLVVLSAAAVAMVILTYSRGSLGVLLFALLIWGSLGSARRRVALIIGGGVSALAVFPLIAWRFQDLLVDPNTGDPEGNSFIWRILNARRLLGLFGESPVFGHGLGSIVWVNPTQTRTQEGFEKGFAAHNEIIRVMVEQGAIGLIAWVVFGVVFLRTLRRMTANQRAASDGGHPEIGAALFSFFASRFILSAIGTEFLSHTATLYVIAVGTAALYCGQRASVIPATHGKELRHTSVSPR